MQNRTVAPTVGPLAVSNYTHRIIRAVVCALCVLATAPCAHAAASFTVLGFAPGDNYSYATGVSADGSVVVGISGFHNDYGGYPPNTYQVFRWSAGTGMVGLGQLPGYVLGTGGSVSADGSTVVGTSQYELYVTSGQAFRWTAGLGMTGLGYLPGGTNSSATGVSSNGSIVIGTCSNASFSLEAVYWEGSGIVGLGYLPGGTNSSPSGLSADGSVIVGTSSSSSGSQAFRWTAGSGMVGLGYLPGGTNSSASGISADGSVIVGTSDSASGSQAFRWTAGSGMVGLGYLSGGTNSSASGISADGSVVVGMSYSASGIQAFRWTTGSGMIALGNDTDVTSVSVSTDGSIAVGLDYDQDGNVFRWANGSGMQSLWDMLVANVAGLTGVVEEFYSGTVSANGNTICGEEGGPEAFVATIPGLIGVSPPLSINSSLSAPNQVVLSWSTNYTGCTLQSSTDLGSTNWTNCASSTVSGAYFVVTNPMSAGAQFFRLQR